MINRISAFYNNKLVIINQFYQCSDYLAGGKYVFDDTLSYIYLKKQNSKIISKELFGNLYKKH